jgi:hypothetical protein
MMFYAPDSHLTPFPVLLKMRCTEMGGVHHFAKILITQYFETSYTSRNILDTII